MPRKGKYTEHLYLQTRCPRNWSLRSKHIPARKVAEIAREHCYLFWSLSLEKLTKRNVTYEPRHEKTDRTQPGHILRKVRSKFWCILLCNFPFALTRKQMLAIRFVVPTTKNVQCMPAEGFSFLSGVNLQNSDLFSLKMICFHVAVFPLWIALWDVKPWKSYISILELNFSQQFLIPVSWRFIEYLSAKISGW